jgi:1-deoxy-D-xylulose-5-phosphate synthase
MIRSLNIDYSGPIDGHDILQLLKLKRLQKNKGPKFLHIITTKGKGLKEDQVKYHAPGKLTLVQVKSIKTRRKPSSEIPRRFWVNDIRFSPKKKKIVGLHPHALRKFQNS